MQGRGVTDYTSARQKFCYQREDKTGFVGNLWKDLLHVFQTLVNCRKENGAERFRRRKECCFNTRRTL